MLCVKRLCRRLKNRQILINRLLTKSISVLLIATTGNLVAVNGGWGQTEKNVRDIVRNGAQRIPKQPAARIPPKPPGDFYRFDDRHSHYRYYPRFGYIAPRIPDDRIRVVYRNRDYFYYSGIWYQPHGLSFEVIAPPIGIYVPVLPRYYTTIWVNHIPYYYANNVYYVWRYDRSRYQVVEPPSVAEKEELPLVADELFIYPKDGQNETQIADDRYHCHVWSRDQTQYDPTQPPTDLPVTDLSRKRDDYHRAMRACLEGSGYSVR